LTRHRRRRPGHHRHLRDQPGPELHRTAEVTELQNQRQANVHLFDILVETAERGDGLPIPFMRVGSGEATVALVQGLLRSGFFALPIFFPIIGRGRAALRVLLLREHVGRGDRRVLRADQHSASARAGRGGCRRLKPTLMLVGGSRALAFSVDMAESVLAQAAARGVRTLVTSTAPVLAATPSIVAAADEAAAVGFTEPEETAKWARRRVAAGEPIVAVFALLEMAQVAAAETAAAIGAPGNPPEVIRRIRTKDACRAALAAAGFAQPAVRLCASAADAEAFLREAPGPCILKPRDAMGSTGVSRVSSAADLPVALALLPDADTFLIEEFVSGPEFSVEGIFQGGRPRVLAVTAKETVPPPFFVETAHTLPADLPECRRREIEETVSAALLTLGCASGPSMPRSG
jgi:ATP-grasp domain